MDDEEKIKEKGKRKRRKNICVNPKKKEKKGTKPRLGEICIKIKTRGKR